jgi:SAM-dependent methyltransferase
MNNKMEAVRGGGTEENRILDAYARRQRVVPRERYSPFNRGNLVQAQELDRCIIGLLRQHGRTSLESQNILEIGCGAGYWLRKFVEWGARPQHLFGIDLIKDRILEARQLVPPAVTLESGNAAELKVPNEAFDIVCQFTVFTSILDPSLRALIASEMLRVLKENGIILWYDFCVNNPWNSDVKRVTKKEISELFAGCRLDLVRTTVAPPLARALGGTPPLVYWAASGIKILCTHYAGVIQK